MSTTQRVSDEVWRSVPQKTLPAGRVWAALGVVAVLLVAGIWASNSGLVVPHLTVASSGSASEADSGRFDYRMEIRNEGSADVVLTDVTIDAEWLEVEAIDLGSGSFADRADPDLLGTSALPVTIPAGGTTWVRFIVGVDCAARQDVGVPILMQARARFGTHGVAYEPKPSGSMVDPTSVEDQPWPVAMSDWVCTPYTGDADE